MERKTINTFSFEQNAIELSFNTLLYRCVIVL